MSYDPKAAQRRNIAEAKAALTQAKSKSDPLRVGRKLLIGSLVEARYRRHFSQADLARRAGLPQSTVARLEAEKANPTLKTLLKIAKALGVNLMVE